MYSIAIDGPAGAGKSVIAKNLSKDLGYIYVDTGAMYRALALFVLRNNIDIEDEELIRKKIIDVEVSIFYKENTQLIFLNNEDVTSLIRTEEIGGVASKISIYKEVRNKLLYLQRKLAKENNVVMDGRDIASFVLPNADLKIYLTASVDERARRRFTELKEKGIEEDLEKIKKDIEIRDYRDMNRDIAPLKRVEEAIYIDTSNMSIKEVLNTIKSYINIGKV